MKKIPERFIIIDDDPINNMICRTIINSKFPQLEVVAFEIPEQGLEYVEENFALTEKNVSTILLLDINMGTISGWQFLELFDSFASEIKNNILIYILTSSLSERDLEKANNNDYVKGYLQKPFSSLLLGSIMDKLE